MAIKHANLLRSTELSRPASRVRGLLAATAAALLAGACSADIGMLGGSEAATASLTADATKQSKSDLAKATEYWGAEHNKKPTDLKAGLNYARNLKAGGHKNEAFAVLQSLALLHGDSKDLASEYGRLALDLGQVQVAQQLLTMADDPLKPDWRVISALGTVQAKQGKYSEAIPFYDRALELSPNQPSVLNNLAMAHAANGEPGKAEDILRRLSADGGDAKIKQNLALVLSLQNKPAEGANGAGAGAPPSMASAPQQPRTMADAMADATSAATPASTPARVASSAKRAKAVDKAAAPTIARAVDSAPQMRDSAGPAAVSSAGGWNTSVARAD